MKLGLLALFSASLSLFLILNAYFFLQIGWWREANPTESRLMVTTRAKNLAQEVKKPSRKKTTPVPFLHQFRGTGAISRHIKQAAIASEDSRFLEHEGVDWEGVLRAFQKNMKSGHTVAGGSTITQQLAKNMLLNARRSYLRKAEELLLSKMFEFWMDKDRILTLYLNFSQWGKGIYGIEAAARHYFGVSAKQLSAQQAARLIVLLPNPEVYQKNIYSPYLNARSAWVLSQMPYVKFPR